MKRLGFLLIAALCCASCGAPASPDAAGTAPAQDPTTPLAALQAGATALKPPSGPPKYGGLMVVPSPEGPKTMDPYFTQGVTMSHVGGLVYNTLVGLYQPAPDYDDFRGSNRVEPQLAETWERPDDRTFVFHLRQGVKFHNGDDFSADDVLFSFNYVRDPKNSFPARSSYRVVEDVEKIDPYTVKVSLSEPSADFIRLLTTYDAYMLDGKFITGGGDPKKTAVGTGPFRQVRFDPNSESIAVKFDQYWDSGKPYLDGVRNVFGLDPASLLAAFTTRKIDSYNVTDKLQFDNFRAQVPDLKYYVYHGDYDYGWYPNITRGPIADVRVRRAMNLAIDRDAINNAVAFGIGRISPTLDAAGSLKGAGISQEELFKTPGWRRPKDQDIADAKRLLQEAGYPDGFRAKGLFISTYTTVPQIAEQTANQFKTSLGIDIDLVPMDTSLWFDAVQNKGSFDIAMGSTFLPSSPDLKLTSYWYSKGGFNKSGIDDPALDELILAEKRTYDDAERRTIFARIQKIMMDQVYYMPTVDTAYFGVVQPWVNNLYGNFAAQSQLRKPAEVWFDVDAAPQDRRRAPR